MGIIKEQTFKVLLETDIPPDVHTTLWWSTQPINADYLEYTHSLESPAVLFEESKSKFDMWIENFCKELINTTFLIKIS